MGLVTAHYPGVGVPYYLEDVEAAIDRFPQLHGKVSVYGPTFTFWSVLFALDKQGGPPWINRALIKSANRSRAENRANRNRADKNPNSMVDRAQKGGGAFYLWGVVLRRICTQTK